jgi:hypothetical protein
VNTGPKTYQIISDVLAPGQAKQIPGTGDRFYFFEADDTINVKTSNGIAADFPAQTGVIADPSNIFDLLTLKNETGAPISYKLYYGFGDVLDKRKDVTVQGNVTISGQPLSIIGVNGGQAVEISATTMEAELLTIAADLAAIAAQMPAALDADGRLKIGANAIGAQGNAWAAAAVGAGGTSAAIDTKDAASVSAFGHVSAATTITVQVSQDNVTFYDTATTAVLGGAADFHVSLQTGAKYSRLKSSGAANITATIAAKG